MKILNDTYAQEDSIGQKIYGDGLVEVIKSIDSNGSFTIGVYGEWGSGKTSLLKQIQNEIELQNDKIDEKIPGEKTRRPCNKFGGEKGT